jgi:L-fuconate dehydratase
MQMAIGAVLNAVWDLASRSAGVPLWQLLSSMSPAALADLVDFRYLSDALTPSEATGLLADAAPERQQRTLDLLDHGYPAYATTPGWLGYSDAKMTRLIEQAVSDGFTQIKLKVGRDLAEDIRRLSLARRVVGPGIQIAVDANQRWDRDTAIEWIRALQQWDPWWVEEPTSPDDILAHQALRRAVRPTRIATGEHVHNRVMFKQLLQAEAVDVVQIDAARVAGVHENLAILLLATKYGVPVCPHAGGVGLCEMVQHLSMFDYVAVSGTQEGRAIEWVDHLHEHFEDPAVVKDGRYLAPVRPGFSTRMRLSSRRRFMYPDGPAWSPDPGLPGAPACPSRLSGGTA